MSSDKAKETTVAGWLSTDQPDLFFEDNAVGQMKHELWQASDEVIDQILEDYAFPADVEWGKPGSYIQTTPRHQVLSERAKNDIVFVPIGCTENHGLHLPSGTDTLFCSQLVEGVRRFVAARDGAPPALSLPPLNFGAHPYHHIGMPGTSIVRDEMVCETLVDVMLGLYNDGFRKIILVNNHGMLWVLESAIQRFCTRYQLPWNLSGTGLAPFRARVLPHQAPGRRIRFALHPCMRGRDLVRPVPIPGHGRHGIRGRHQGQVLPTRGTLRSLGGALPTPEPVL